MKIHRFNTYPDSKLNEKVSRSRSFQTKDGKTYSITVQDNEQGSFQLNTPDGHAILDSIHELSDRQHLYELLEPGLFDWLLEVRKSIQEEQLKEVGIVRAELNHNNERYRLTVNKNTGVATLRIPEQFREFDVEDIYVINPELPLLLDGRLLVYFQEEIEEQGVNLPPTPYYLGFKAMKDTEDNEGYGRV